MRRVLQAHKVVCNIGRAVGKALAPIQVWVVVVAVTFSPLALKEAAAEEGNRFFTFTFENDIFTGSDKGYTNGTGLTLGRAGFSNFNRNNTPSWILKLTERLPIVTKENRLRGISHMFFQRMQTPEIIINPDFNPDDLPYAGLLAWQGTMYSSDDKSADQLSLFLGVVGPAALGEEAQKAVHSLTGSDEPLGWGNQIRNTPIAKIEYQKNWSLYKTQRSSLEFEFLGLGGAGLGNLKTATKWGFAFRIGKNLERSLGAFSLQADRQVNPLAFSRSNDWYTFVGARAGFVAYDILIEGDLPDDLEHNLSSEAFRNDIAAGVVWKYGRFAYVFELASSSAPVEEIDDRQNFGAFSVTLSF